MATVAVLGPAGARDRLRADQRVVAIEAGDICDVRPGDIDLAVKRAKGAEQLVILRVASSAAGAA